MVIIRKIKIKLKNIHDRFVFYAFWMCKHQGRRAHGSKTILVIRLDAIGDCIIWLDQAKEYKKKYPNHKIVLLHNLAWAEIAKQLPWFDQCVPFDRSKIGDRDYYKHLIAELNKYTYEKVYSPVFSRDFFTVDWIVHNVNAVEKIGYEGDYQNNDIVENYIENVYIQHKVNALILKQKADKWYDHLVPNDHQLIMELQRNAHFVQQTFDKNFRSHLPYIPFKYRFPSEMPNSDYSVFFLGASNSYKMWPVECFVQLTDYVFDQTIILGGSLKEKQLAQLFLSSYKGKKHIIDMTGKTTLTELMGVIYKANLIVSNDTSASHIAVAVRTLSVCILGGGHYGRFHPYQVDVISEHDKKYLPLVATSAYTKCFNCNNKCIFPLINNHWKCIDEITVNDVIQIIKSIG